MLKSRLRYESPDEFVDSFLKSITPGIIPRGKFIKWQSLREKLECYREALSFFEELEARVLAGAELWSEFKDSIMASDNPAEIIKCSFEILGHTNPVFIAKEEAFDIEGVAEKIRGGDESKAEGVVETLKGIGLGNLFYGGSFNDMFLGVQIGLETHRRKNIGGEYFKKEVGSLLYSVAQRLGGKTRVVEEHRIDLDGGLSKKVDFAFSLGESVFAGVEVNFYTVSGSKPTEIKRSYGDIMRRLKEQGIDLIWITDGFGYTSMKRSLRDAFVIFPNIYNYKMASESLFGDLKELLAVGRQ